MGQRERERERKKTEVVEKGDKEAAWFSIACVCPCEQMASIPCAVRRLEADPLL